MKYYLQKPLEGDFEFEMWVRSYRGYFLRHREVGPAIIHADGSKEWWVNGEFIRENPWNEI